MRRILCGAVSIVVLNSATLASPNLKDRNTAIRESIQAVRLISPEWVCAVVDPTEEILAVRWEKYGDALAADKAGFETGKIAWWYWPFSQQFRMLNVQKTYHQPLFAEFNKPEFWSLNGTAPADVTVWSHSIDGFPNWDSSNLPTEECGNYSRTADMVYLRPGTPIRSGDQVTVQGKDGRSGSLAFDEEATPCWSIKVNQSAYPVNAEHKRAYLGMWIPAVGPADFSAFEGKPFHVKAFEPGARWDEGRATGEPVFTGEIKTRMKFDEQDIKREGGSNATGEDVYELDFSGLNAEGTYCIQIPGLGRSWPFRVTANGHADAFYTMMKGLYIQRCGIELKAPYTAWARPECHTETRQGAYIPETEGWYGNNYRKDKPEFGFRDAQGAKIAVAAFTLIGNEDTNAPVMRGVKGGWHDAADFDRRIHHYGVVNDLLGLFDAFPGRFTDDQLNIPESGNGIPDLLDEAAYGVEVWRRTQREDGGVSSWLEQESHPGAASDLNKSFVENQMAMFASIPDRAGSYAYAAAASWLGRLLMPYDKERGMEYVRSAQRAYRWASTDDSVMRQREFKIEKPMRNANLKGQTIRFDEDPEITHQDRSYGARAIAAAHLFAITGQEGYHQDLVRSEFGKRFPTVAWSINPMLCLPLLNQPGLTDDEKAAMRKAILEAADKLVASQQLFAYRTLWMGPTEGWFHTMAWGNIYSKSRNLVAAYAITKAPQYKASLEASADFFLGCNPMGQTMVTGIGSVYPVVIQHIHSLADGIPDPTPGIAPYTFTYGISMRPFVINDGGHASVKEYFDHIAIAFIPDKLGRAEIQAGLDAHEKTGNWTHPASLPAKDVIWKNFPVFRRKVTHPGAAVDQNEFTVNETISPLALLFGALTADTWSVTDEVKNRQPRRSIDEVPYYYMP